MLTAKENKAAYAKEWHRKYREANGKWASFEWKKANPDKNRESAKRYRDKNPEKKAKSDTSWANKNREYLKDKHARWREKNPDKVKNNYLKAKFGITLEKYNALLAEQENKCAICKTTENRRINGKARDFCVDHDHKTGNVRALLCDNCNSAIGLLKESIGTLLNAIEYLRRYGGE